MEINKLKELIENKNIDNSFKIFKLTDESSSIISEQYIKLISSILNLHITYIDSINDIPDAGFIEDTNLYILKVEEWNDSHSNHDNCIVICNKTKDSRAIIIPKLEDWQVVDYCLGIYKDLGGVDILNTLIKKYDGNYTRFIKDLSLVQGFNPKEQKYILEELVFDGYFDDIVEYKIWDISNAIIKRDLNTLRAIMKSIDYIDVDPLGLAKVLYNNFKTITSIQLNHSVSAKELGVSDKQFFVIKKYNCGFYTNEELIDILTILTNIERLFKYESVSLNELIDYIIIKIFKE